MSSYQVLFVMCLILAIWWLQALKSCSLHKFFTKDTEFTKCFLSVVPLDHGEKIKLDKFSPDFSIITKLKVSFLILALRMVTISVTMT